MENILKEILFELKSIRAILEEQKENNKLHFIKVQEAQKIQREKAKELLKTINPQFADMI